MAIAAGTLTERITLQKATVTRNSIGEEVAGWTDIITDLPAAVRWLKGSRALTFGDVWNPATVKITCRYREAFEEAERVLWHGKEFMVVSAFGDRVNMNMTITADLYHEGKNAEEPEPPVPVYLTAWKIAGNSEVHTLPYPDGIVLPTGYKRCEYLESDGTAYIELPFGFNYTDEMYAKVKFNNTYGSERHIISLKGWNTDKNTSSRFCFASVSRGSVISFASALGSLSALQDDFTPTAPFNLSVCEVNYSNKQYTLLNESKIFVRNLNYATFGPETSHICLLKNFDNEGTEGAIYEYRHKKANAEYRLIPCLDSNNTPCMYDVINNQAYYNSAESGSFTYKLYPQPTEIWSCGEYSETDSKYHVVVLPTGKQAVDIVLDEPLRKVNDIADTLEYPLGISGKALLTTRVAEIDGELTPLVTPTIALVDVPQIEESTEYSNVITPGSKAVEWSEFSTDSEVTT